jgi:hypothetical protein
MTNKEIIDKYNEILAKRKEVLEEIFPFKKSVYVYNKPYDFTRYIIASVTIDTITLSGEIELQPIESTHEPILIKL